MQLIKLTTKQKELLETEVKPLLTNDLSFNVELVNSILDINYRKIDICTIVKYTKECLFNNKNPLAKNFRVLNLSPPSFLYTYIEIIPIRKNVDYYEYNQYDDGNEFYIALYKNNKIQYLDITDTYLFDDVVIRLTCYKNTNILPMFVLI